MAQTLTTHHKLKCWPAPFLAAKVGVLTFQIRNNDRAYQRGDTVTLEEFIPNGDPGWGTKGTYTGDKIGPFEITYVLSGWGLAPGHVGLQLALVESVQPAA
jgi:hypothetical protein